MYSIDAFPGRTIAINGKSYLYFGGTAYLGLQTHTEFKQLFIQNIEKYGTNYSASRKANIQIAVFDKAEKRLAEIVGSQSCMTLSSGYLAGQVLSKTLENDAYEFFYAPNTHVALYPKEKKSYHSFAALKDALNEHLNNPNKATPVLFIDSLESLENGYPHFKDLEKLPLNKIVLVVDDSHGIGILGKDGGGAFQAIQKLQPKELIICASLGKGFGIQGGAIFGSAQRIKQLVGTESFGGGSPATPASLGTFLDAQEVFSKNRGQLKENYKTFIKTVKNTHYLSWTSEHPAFSFSNIELISFLKEQDILLTNFNYPNETSPLVSRIVLSAHHTAADIKKLVKALNAFDQSIN